MIGTFVFFSQKMEGKGKRDTRHGKLEQCVREVLYGIDGNRVGEENTFLEAVLNCKLIRNRES